ncbi:trichohyalin [Trypanosoma grayi]|uniref:trichohyalin n=1 Tax=Trypanosoma grayi TaxID=71804 RepID=UPI0004F43CE1|nr:trichohyalin [Trypanosoma grayi]KEG14481.1 trichohyalin [Trypanosoma grayi]
MNILVACREGDCSAVSAILKAAQLPAPASACNVEAAADLVVQHVCTAVCSSSEGVATVREEVGWDMVMMGVEDVLVGDLSLSGVTRQMVSASLADDAGVEASLVLFQPHHDIVKGGVEVTAKLFPDALGGYVAITSAVEYDALLDIVKGSASFCHVVRSSSLLMRLILRRGGTQRVVVNVWWVQEVHARQFLFPSGRTGEWRPSLCVLVLAVRDAKVLQERLLSFHISHAAIDSFLQQQGWAPIEGGESLALAVGDAADPEEVEAELRAVRREIGTLYTFIQQERKGSAALEKTLEGLRETSRSFAKEQERLEERQHDILQSAKRRKEKFDEQRSQVDALNDTCSLRVAALRCECDRELQLEMVRADSERARVARAMNEEVRHTVLQAERIRSNVLAAQQRRERLLDDIARRRSRVATLEEEVHLRSESCSTDDSAPPHTPAASVVSVRRQDVEAELRRLDKRWGELRQSRAALLEEKRELEVMGRWWAEQSCDGNDTRRSGCAWARETWELRQAALVGEERAAREALWAVESANRCECIELERLRAHCACRVPLAEGSRQSLLLDAKEQRRRDAMLREIERFTRLKAAMRREMRAVQLQGVDHENALRQHLEELSSESARLERERDAFDNAALCNGVTAEAKDEVESLRCTLLLMEACVEAHLPFDGPLATVATASDWHTVSYGVMTQRQRVQEELAALTERMRQLQEKCAELEQQTTAEKDTLEAVSLQKTALKCYVRAHAQTT